MYLPCNFLAVSKKEAYKVEKGDTKLFLLHAHGTIDNDFTTLGDIVLARPSKGMEIILAAVCAARLLALFDLIFETCTIAKEHECLSLRSELVSTTYVSLSFFNHLVAAKLSIKGATSLNNEAISINPSSFLPQKNTCMIKSV
jgi:hypothetical protein